MNNIQNTIPSELEFMSFDAYQAFQTIASKNTDGIQALQATLDYARSRRNSAYSAYDHYNKKPQPNLGMLHCLNEDFRKEQAFYEGVAMAIYAAGYGIKTQVGSDECTVTPCP